MNLQLRPTKTIKTYIKSMKTIPEKAAEASKALALILCLGVLPLGVIGTGGTTGTRYTQSTGEKIDDHTLSSRVRTALGNDTQYKYGDVKVVTFKGVVQLNGFVNSSDQKKRAGDLARSAEGVSEIENNVSVK